jgi:hypothetical protein
MLAKVEQHVDEARAHLARRFERPSVIALGPHLAPSPDGAIDGARTPHGEPLHAPDQPAPFVGFDEQVKMIRLDRKVNEPKR